MKIADILDRAIDLLGEEDGFSCGAVTDALEEADAPFSMDDAIMDGLWAMGLNTRSTEAFSDIKLGPRRQYARALWLTWAAMIAREQGV